MTRPPRDLARSAGSGSRLVGGDRCVVIGEIAQAHDGSLGLAHSYIDAIADAGADAVKFQTHIADAESTPREPWRTRFSEQDESRFAYWRRMEFSGEQWAGLKRHAEERGMVFLSSPFSLKAVDLLDALGIVAWKVASGEVANRPMLERIAATGREVILSSGMSSLDEIDRAVDLLRQEAVPFSVLQCTSRYPCPPEQVGANLLESFRSRYDCPVGLSDHSGTIYAGLAAATLGASAIEVHVTLTRQMFGPDVPVSITPAELASLVEGADFIQRMLRSPVDKDAMSSELTPIRMLFTKSLVAARSLPVGTILRREDLLGKKPGDGLPVDRLPELLGKKLVRTLAADEPISEDDLEPSSSGGAR